MNPELQRNLWLELTRRRMIQMAVVLALIFFTVDLANARLILDTTAQYLFYGIVVLWGTRDAAQAVVGEIRERTWDFQRLSALSPMEMTWGKLLGATSYVWFGGLICLAVLVSVEAPARDWARLLADLVFYLCIGLTAHAVALFLSLVAVRRRQTHTRYNVFQYQAAGVTAAWLVWTAWQSVKNGRVAEVEWWGTTYDALVFTLVSLALFLGWTLTGCYRLMRLELQVRNGLIVWTAFLAFLAVYAAGFDQVPFGQFTGLERSTTLRFALATSVLAVLTYLAVLFEAKDPVLYRWLGEMARKGRWMDVVTRLQCWMIAYAATVIVAVAFALHLNGDGPIRGLPELAPAMLLSGLGFLTRDLGIFLFFALAPGQKRGDMPALVTLGLLYLLAPMLLTNLGRADPNIFLFPARGAGGLGVVIAWAEAAAVWFGVYSHRFQTMGLKPIPRSAGA